MASVGSPLSKRSNPPYGQFSVNNRIPASRTSYARLVVFHYTKQNFGVPSNVGSPFAEGTAYNVKTVEIINEIASVKVSKFLDRPSGIFDVALFPTQNWKQTISPGDWVAIYLYSKDETQKKNTKFDTKNMVMLGNIDRISRSLFRDEGSDKVELRYNISGRNFGKVFEELDIWYDPYAIKASTDTRADIANSVMVSSGAALRGSADKLINDGLKLFLGEGLNLPLTGKTKPLEQWRIPSELASLFNISKYVIGKPLFYDILNKEITSGLPGTKPRSMVSSRSNGNLWEMLSRNSNGIVNELFLEEVRASDGSVKPTIVLRPRPLQTPFFESHFKKDGDGLSALKGKWKSMQNFAKESYVEITPAEIFYENLGRDDHSRMNLFWLNNDRLAQLSQTNAANVNNEGKLGLPTFRKESINRHGLKRFEQLLEFDTPEGQAEAAATQYPLIKGVLGQVYDLHYANHLYEGGTIETSGVLEAELGKVLVILSGDKDKTASPDRLFYIEGYEHEWKYPNTWRTVFTLSHGQFRATGQQNVFIDATASDFGKNDNALDYTYLAKTEVIKK